MADTQRSITALLALLPVQLTRAIGSQDVRDIIETLRSGHAECYISTPAETTISTQDVFVKAAGTTTLSANSHNWTMPQNNRLTYGGTADRVVHLACSVTMTSAGSNVLWRGRIAKNGTTLAASEVRRQIGTGSDQGSTAIHSFFSVSANDYVELWIANGTNNSNFTMETMNLFVMDMAL